MIWKNLIIFSAIVGTIFGISFEYLVYIIPIEHNRIIHESLWITNCVPAGPDERVLEVGLKNGTHSFDLRNCKWVEK